MQHPNASDRYYRAYILDEFGKIRRAEILYAKTDDEALVAAAQIENKNGIELWEGARLIGHIDPATKPQYYVVYKRNPRINQS